MNYELDKQTYNRIYYIHVLTSLAQRRINFFAVSLQMAGTVKTHLMSPSLISDKFCFLKAFLKSSTNALIECVKTCFAEYSVPLTSSMDKSSFMTLKDKIKYFKYLKNN